MARGLEDSNTAGSYFKTYAVMIFLQILVRTLEKENKLRELTAKTNYDIRENIQRAKRIITAKKRRDLVRFWLIRRDEIRSIPGRATD